jgi:hypothetical protein
MSLDSCSRTTWHFIHLKFILIRINILSSSVGQTSVDRRKNRQTSPNRQLIISSAECLRTALLTLVASVHPVWPEFHLVVVVHVDGVRKCLWTAATNGPIVHPWYIEYGQPWWNDTDRGNRGIRIKTSPSATLSTTNPTWTDPGANPGRHGKFHLYLCIVTWALCDYVRKFQH